MEKEFPNYHPKNSSIYVTYRLQRGQPVGCNYEDRAKFI